MVGLFVWPSGNGRKWGLNLCLNSESEGADSKHNLSSGFLEGVPDFVNLSGFWN